MTNYPKGTLARRLSEEDNPTGYPRGSQADKIVRAERRVKKQRKESEDRKKKKKVTKPDPGKGRSFNQKLLAYETLTGESALQPLQDLIRGPSAPDIPVPDLASEVREGVEAKKALIRATPKMYPMYYERAKKGKFIKVKTKLGRTKKTKLL